MGAMGKHSTDVPAGAASPELAAATPALAPTSASAPAPMPTPSDEAERRRTLRNHKAFVTGLLIVATMIYLACRWVEHNPGGDGVVPTWVGYVRAAAEAGMIGGLADWFAVTALFRYPMGLKIPHTAIIPRKKDQLGDALSEFVGENFLNAELITEKVRKADIPERLGQWLSQPENAARASHEVGRLSANAVRAVDPADAEAVINHAVIEKLASPEWGPPAGRLLEQLIEDGRTEPLIQEALRWAHRKAIDSGDLIIRVIDERKPIWAPQFLNNIVGEKVHRELVSFTSAVSNNPDHQARHAIRKFLRQLATDLQEDPTMVARMEALKEDIMGSTPVQNAAATLWRSLSASLIESSEDPESLLRRKITELCLQWGERLHSDPELRASLDRRITGAAAFLADNYSEEITSIISETVQRWDAAEASEKIELMVGKDLQFIRLNGTIVGALAGLAIYTVSQLLFSF